MYCLLPMPHVFENNLLKGGKSGNCKHFIPQL